MNPYAFCENSKCKPFCQKLCAGRTVLFALLCGVALEKILLDAVCSEPIEYEQTQWEEDFSERPEKYRKYQKEPYIPTPHYRRDESTIE